MKIIIADDEKDFTDILRIMLMQKGYEIVVDPNGSVVKNLGKDLPDLILLDINLQSRDGGDLCALLKEGERTKNIPIILISAIMDLKQISQFCGAEDFLIKPFDKHDLIEKIDFHLNHVV